MALKTTERFELREIHELQMIHFSGTGAGAVAICALR